MKKVVGLVIVLLPISAFAECVPSPDCASIGYTETSCDGGSVKCPFDTSKLRCIPCDSSFRYSCDGENVVSAVGAACNNKYVTCNCVEGATLNNGECICDKSCKMGNIYYSDGTCSSCVDSNKTAVGVVVKDNELVVSKTKSSAKWCATIVSVNIPSTDTETAKTDYDGKAHTAAIVEAYGEDADTSLHAGVYCHNFSTEGTNAGDWYLPAAGELYDAFYTNYEKIASTYKMLGINSVAAGWSSSHDGWWNGMVIQENKYINAATKSVGVYNVYCFLPIS